MATLVPNATAKRASPSDLRADLTGAFYAVAYVGMMMPLAASTVARSIGFVPVLAGLTILGAVGSSWLAVTAKTIRPPTEHYVSPSRRS